MTFDIEPNIGAHPIKFGMTKSEVHALLGLPRTSSTLWDKSGTADYWLEACVNVGYDNDGIAFHVGFAPGNFELSLLGSPIWSPHDHADPNPVLLKFDAKPMERLGFLVFRRLGVTSTGYHDGDEGQRALTVFAPGKWDEQLLKATMPYLSRYLP